MTDLASNLVAKLRAEVVVPYKNGYEPLRAPPSKLMTDAADEIERLTADFQQVHHNCIHARRVADKALELLNAVRLDRMAPEWKCALVEVRELAKSVPSVETTRKPRTLSASERLHNICDALSEQADESPFTREEWDAVDIETVRLQECVRVASHALGAIAGGDVYPQKLAREALDLIAKPPQVETPCKPLASTDDGASPSRPSPSSVECPKCRTQLAFEGDICGLCQ